MGSLTDFFKYLECAPDRLEDEKTKLYHITITERTKKIRNSLKLYKKECRSYSLFDML